METLCHLEEEYYCNVCSHSLCILATYLAFLCQVFNGSSFRVLTNIGNIVLKMLHVPKKTRLINQILIKEEKNKPKQNKQKETPKVPRCLDFYFGCHQIYLYL